MKLNSIQCKVNGKTRSMPTKESIQMDLRVMTIHDDDNALSYYFKEKEEYSFDVCTLEQCMYTMKKS